MSTATYDPRVAPTTTIVLYDTCAVVDGGEPVHLTPNEHWVLDMLADAAPRHVPAHRLLGIDQTKVYVRRLRQKLGSDLIRNEWGYGYRLMAQVEIR